MNVRVLVVDDQALVRRGIVSLVRTAPDMEVVGEACDGDDALLMIPRLKPDVVLCDVRMPRMGGIALLRAIRERSYKTQVLLLSTFDDSDVLVEAMKSGAAGLLLKSIEPEPLLQALRAAARGERSFGHVPSDRLLEALARTHRAPDGALRSAGTQAIDLTPREQAVMDLMSRGLANRDIAEALGLAEGTVKNHVSVILGKLGIADRMKAVLFAIEHGLVRRGL